MDDSHSNRLVGRSPIPISIPEWNENGSTYIELNPYSLPWIQFFIPIPIPILIPIPMMNQTLWRIWPFWFRFQIILIFIPILIPVVNQTLSKYIMLPISTERCHAMRYMEYDEATIADDCEQVLRGCLVGGSGGLESESE